MLICFCAQIGKIDIAIFQTRNRENFKTGHHRAGGICPVRRGRDETDLTMGLAARRVILADREQPGEFSLRSSIGLQRNGGKA